MLINKRNYFIKVTDIELFTHENAIEFFTDNTLKIGFSQRILREDFDLFQDNLLGIPNMVI